MLCVCVSRRGAVQVGHFELGVRVDELPKLERHRGVKRAAVFAQVEHRHVPLPHLRAVVAQAGRFGGRIRGLFEPSLVCDGRTLKVLCQLQARVHDVVSLSQHLCILDLTPTCTHSHTHTPHRVRGRRFVVPLKVHALGLVEQRHGRRNRPAFELPLFPERHHARDAAPVGGLQPRRVVNHLGARQKV